MAEPGIEAVRKPDANVVMFTPNQQSAGQRLRAAREAAGYSLADMAVQTKIPARMLGLIESGDYAALPARTYATGFTRTYARLLGLDEKELVAAVRAELGMNDPVEPRVAAAFEPGDPARVPTARFAWLAAVAALVIVAAGLLLWRTYYTPAATLPPIAEETAAAVPAPAAAPLPTAATPVAGLPTGAAAVASPAGAGAGQARTASAPARTPAQVPAQAPGQANAPQAPAAVQQAAPAAGGGAPSPASTAAN